MQIKIEYHDRIREIEEEEGKTALEICKENGIQMPAICGGQGTCGKCRIRCVGANEISSEEIYVLSAKEIEQGIRLACKVVPLKESKIQIMQDETAFEAVTEYEANQKNGLKAEQKNDCRGERYLIAIDIGTTTIAGILLEESADTVLASESKMNRQRIYGADVISRVHASNTGNREKLQECIRTDLREMIEALIRGAGIEKEELIRIALSGNTVMIHILMGYSCEKLGRSPFTPVNLDPIYGNCKDLLDCADWKSDVFILPGISAFVGGDITAGLLATDFIKSDGINLLIDLGTNGEMAVGNKKRIWVTSAAAGPAFEGGNIAFGTGSIKGAVCHADWTGSEMKLETIGNVLPVTGICGTGALELLSECLKAGFVDYSGLMDEAYFRDGYPLGTLKSGEKISFMQKDIRELQLAKAAIYAGIVTLMEEADITFEQLDAVYLAGGFGYSLDIDKAVRIGLLPKEFKGKVKTVGNSSLYGAVLYAKQKEFRELAVSIREISKEIVLAKTEAFQQKYMDSIDFIKN